jgi:hypothetical protein
MPIIGSFGAGSAGGYGQRKGGCPKELSELGIMILAGGGGGDGWTGSANAGAGAG